MAIDRAVLAGVPFLVDKFSRRTDFERFEVRLAKGVSDFRVRRLAPPRYLVRISAAADDGDLGPLAALVSSDHFAPRTLDQGGLYLFGPEVGSSPVSVRLQGRGNTVRRGPDDYRLEFSLALLSTVSPTVPASWPDLPFSYEIQTGFADDTRNHFQTLGTGWNTSEAVPVLRTKLEFPLLREEELALLRAFYYWGVKTDLFALSLGVPIFGQENGFDWSVRIVSFEDSFQGGGYSSASVTLERSR